MCFPRINITKEVKDLCRKTLKQWGKLRKTLEDEKMPQYSWIDRNDIAKMAILPKGTYKLKN